MDNSKIEELKARDKYTSLIARSLAWLLVGCTLLSCLKTFDHDNYMRYFAPYDILIADVAIVSIIASAVCLILWHLHNPSFLYCLSVGFLAWCACFPDSATLVGRMIFCAFMIFYAFISTSKPTASQAKTQVEVKPVVKLTAPACAVCHKESQYEVCLECEREHKIERHRLRAQLARAKENGVAATLTLAQWIETIDAFQRHCAYCQTGPYEVMEHYIPIALGGGTTQENCLPACRSCNSKKSDKHPELGVRVPKLKHNPISALHRPRNTMQPYKA